MVLDGRSTLAFPLLPLTTMRLYMFYKRINKSDNLNNLHYSNFTEVEAEMNDYDFFDGLTDIIPDI
jgi:hypothetical protein